MPSMEESRRHVKDGLNKQHKDNVDHDAILASLQDEIDRHNAVKEGASASIRKSKHSDDENNSERSMKFRFKSGTSDPRKRRKHSSRKDGDEGHSHRKRKRRENYPTPPGEHSDSTSAHPFPREPVEPTESEADPNAAFRTSLFDALADDEGAAYWEGVYNQPIHVYPRPSVPTPQGTLEAMSDEDYANYVKTKMWERKHPELVQERKRKEKERKEEEENKTKRREEFIRRRERAAWERAQGWKSNDTSEDDPSHSGYKYEFAGNANRAPSEIEREEREYVSAWAEYSSAWDNLKYDLLSERSNPSGSETSLEPSKRIPWPVLASKAVIRSNIEAFMQHAPSDSQRSKVALLKSERVKWHPDKVQQRFAGAVDEGTMKIVTGVFQVVDGLLELARKEAGDGV